MLWLSDGFQVEFEGYRVDRITDFAFAFLEERNEGKPFFLFISYLEPHHQNDMERYVGPENSSEKFGDFAPPEDLKNEEGDWKENYPDYLGCCASIDKNVGRIMDKLKEKELINDTVVFYTSDHGSHFRTRNEEYKRSCHEGSIRIPMLAFGPRFRGGKVPKSLVSLLDLPPTILKLAEIKPPRYMKGRNLLDLLENENENWREEVFFQISENEVGRGIRTKDWKYSVRAPHKDGVRDSKSDHYKEKFLYNLNEDPYEQENLINSSDHEEIKRELRTRLKENIIEAGEKIPEISPPTQEQ